MFSSAQTISRGVNVSNPNCARTTLKYLICKPPAHLCAEAPGSARWNVRSSVFSQMRPAHLLRGTLRNQIPKPLSAQLTIQVATTPTSREPRRDIVSVSPRRIYARRRTAIGRKMRGSKGRRKPHRTVFFFPWCAFGDFRHKTKVTARRAGAGQRPVECPQFGLLADVPQRICCEEPYRIDCVKLVRAQLAKLKVESPTSRGLA